jgi:hypothetical protein
VRLKSDGNQLAFMKPKKSLKISYFKLYFKNIINQHVWDCGVYKIGKSTNGYHKLVVEGMASVIVLRGPDAFGSYHNDFVSVANTTLIYNGYIRQC